MYLIEMLPNICPKEKFTQPLCHERVNFFFQNIKSFTQIQLLVNPNYNLIQIKIGFMLNFKRIISPLKAKNRRFFQILVRLGFILSHIYKQMPIYHTLDIHTKNILERTRKQRLSSTRRLQFCGIEAQLRYWCAHTHLKLDLSHNRKTTTVD